MSKWIIRFILFCIFLNIIFWLRSVDSTILAKIGNYEINTDFSSLLLVIFLIYVPLFIIAKLIKLIKETLSKKYHYSTVVKVLNAFSMEEEKNFLVDALKQNSKGRELRRLRKIKVLINDKKYDKALSACKDLKVSAPLQFMLYYFNAIIYKNKGSMEDFIITCKKAMVLVNSNPWFFEQLLDIAVAKKSKDDLLTLEKDFHKVNFGNSFSSEKAFCELKYSLASLYFKENDLTKSARYCNDLTKAYPSFIPVYDILINIAKAKSDDGKIEGILEKAWVANPCLSAIELLDKHYHADNYKASLKFLEKLIDKAKSPQFETILKASFAIRFNKIMEAYDLLQSIPEDSLEKQYLEIKLLEKEENYSELSKKALSLFLKMKKHWWSKFVE
jgi:hypothetical protein